MPTPNNTGRQAQAVSTGSFSFLRSFYLNIKTRYNETKYDGEKLLENLTEET